MLLQFVYFIGLLKFISFSSKLVLFLNRHYSNLSEPDLISKYGGKGSWAVVTGAADGMGA